MRDHHRYRETANHPRRAQARLSPILVSHQALGYTCPMSTQILATKLYKPVLRPDSVLLPRLIERLNVGLHGKLTLATAPAGFGKTTVIAEWISSEDLRVAWLSLDEGDNDPVRFCSMLSLQCKPLKRKSA